MLTKQDLTHISAIVRNELSPVKKGIAKLDKKFISLFNFLDHDLMKTRKDVDKIQEKLNIPRN